MKVKELIRHLSKLDGECEVIMSKDSEGNNFSPYNCYDVGAYVPETTWYGTYYSNAFTPDQNDLTKEEQEQIMKNNPAICLWPVN